MKKTSKDSFMKNSNKVETITISNIEQLKQIIKDKSYNNYELVEPIMIKGVKGQKPEPKAPKWFTEFVNEQRAFNKTVINHLEKHDRILERHDQMFNYVSDVFKRNNLK